MFRFVDATTSRIAAPTSFIWLTACMAVSTEKGLRWIQSHQTRNFPRFPKVSLIIQMHSVHFWKLTETESLTKFRVRSYLRSLYRVVVKNGRLFRHRDLNDRVEIFSTRQNLLYSTAAEANAHLWNCCRTRQRVCSCITLRCRENSTIRHSWNCNHRYLGNRIVKGVYHDYAIFTTLLYLSVFV